MKSNFKKYWKSIVAFATGGAMCLGLGVFVLANPSTQTPLQQDAQPTQTSQVTGELQLVQEGTTPSNNLPYLSVSQVVSGGVYGTGSGDSVDWAAINNAIFGSSGTYTVKLWLQSPSGVFVAPIKVVSGSSISASDNVLRIGDTNFTASVPSSDDYVFAGWTIDGSAIPANSSVSADISVVAQFEVALPWTAMGTYDSTISGDDWSCSDNKVKYPNSDLDGYQWVAFDDSGYRWIIIGAGYSQQSYLPDGAVAKDNETVIGTEEENYEDGELGANHILLLSEQILYIRSDGWGSSSSQTDINSALIQSEWFNSHALYQSLDIVSQKLYTNPAGSSSAVENQPDNAARYFLLAANSSDHGSDGCNFKVETYLNSDNLRIANQGDEDYNYWWLRSGYCDYSDYACIVKMYGSVDYDYVSADYYGVRPCFVLNVDTSLPNAYEVTFDENGGSDVTDGIYLAGQDLPTPTKSGYTFAGWCTTESDNNGTGTVYTSTSSAFGDYGASVPLYAQWGYEVTIQSNDDDYGTVDVSSVVVPSGSTFVTNNNVLTITKPDATTVTITAFAEDGCTFSSWTGIPSDDEVTADVTITATFESDVPWINSGVYDSGIWTGYTWVTFDNSTNWIIIGSGSNNPLNLTSGKGTQNGSNDLSANQILLLSENLVAGGDDGVQYNSSSIETAWTSTTLCTYLNNSDNYDDWGISTSLYSSSSIATPTLTTMKNSDYGNMQTPSNDDYDDTKKIFTLAYGYSGENFCLATYLGGNGNYDENYIANYGDDPYSWWLRSGTSGIRDDARYVYDDGYVDGSSVGNSIGVRPAFVLNLG